MFSVYVYVLCMRIYILYTLSLLSIVLIQIHFYLTTKTCHRENDLYSEKHVFKRQSCGKGNCSLNEDFEKLYGVLQWEVTSSLLLNIFLKTRKTK